MKAFEDYVDNHETATPQPASNNDGSQDVVQASVNVTGEQIPTTPTGNPANNPNENPERVTPTSDIDNFEFEMACHELNIIIPVTPENVYCV